MAWMTWDEWGDWLEIGLGTEYFGYCFESDVTDIGPFKAIVYGIAFHGLKPCVLN